MLQNRWVYFPVAGCVSGILISLLLRIALLIWSGIDLPISPVLITGAGWGLIFGFINAALIEIMCNERTTIKPAIMLSCIFAANSILVILIVFFWLLPLPNLYYMIGLALTVATIAVFATNAVIKQQ